MAYLLITKTADTPYKQVGDIVGVYGDDHKFTEEELRHFGVQHVEGYETALALKKDMPFPVIKRAYRLPVANTWTFGQPEEQEFWQNDKGEWSELKTTPKKVLNISTLTAQDLMGLSSTSTSIEQRRTILAKCKNRIAEIAENNTVDHSLEP